MACTLPATMFSSIHSETPRDYGDKQMTRREVEQTLKAALERVADQALPLAIRIRSKETVALCEERLAAERAGAK